MIHWNWITEKEICQRMEDVFLGAKTATGRQRYDFTKDIQEVFAKEIAWFT